MFALLIAVASLAGIAGIRKAVVPHAERTAAPLRPEGPRLRAPLPPIQPVQWPAPAAFGRGFPAIARQEGSAELTVREPGAGRSRIVAIVDGATSSVLAARPLPAAGAPPVRFDALPVGEHQAVLAPTIAAARTRYHERRPILIEPGRAATVEFSGQLHPLQVVLNGAGEWARAAALVVERVDDRAWRPRVVPGEGLVASAAAGDAGSVASRVLVLSDLGPGRYRIELRSGPEAMTGSVEFELPGATKVELTVRR